MDNMKRFVSVLLCLVMLLGILPVSAFAVDTANSGVVDAAIIFSDLHTSKSDYKESTLKGILNAIKAADLPVSSVTSAGDAFSVNEDYGKYTGYTSTLTGYIRDVFPDVPVNYVWSDHDRYALQEDDSTLLSNDSGFVYGAGEDGLYGTDDDGNYYIYSLSMADLSTNNRYDADFHSDAEVTAAIADFTAAVEELHKDRPLFIASHQPLLDRRNDNGHAYEWATAINAAAEKMDVAFFSGHNHKYDVAQDYYYAKGETMSVCSDSSGNAKDVTLNFTHMCAGYMAPASTYSTSDTTRQGVAVAITIYDDAINYTTYDANGVYTGSYALNETVTREFAAKNEPVETEPTEPEAEPVADSNDTGITVAAPGVTGVSVDVLDVAIPEGYTAYASFDIALEGYEQGTEATVCVPAPASFDANRPVLVLYAGEVIATTKIVGGKVTFTTDHFSTYDLAQAAVEDVLLGEYILVTPDPVDDVTTYGENWTTIKDYVPAIPGTEDTTYHQYVLAAKGVTANRSYLIVNTGSNGTGYALANNSGSVGRKAVTISDGTILLEDGEQTTVEWVISGSSSGTIKNQNRHLFPTNGSLKLNTSASTVNISNRGSGVYRLYDTESYLLVFTRYNWVRYYNNNWTYGSGTSSSGVGSVYLYERGEDLVVPGTAGTPAVPGLYAHLSGTLSVTVNNGTSAADALAAVKSKVTVNYATLADYSDEQSCPDDTEGLTWTLDENYDGTVGGDYAVVIAYNGKTLGVAEVNVKPAQVYYGAMGQKNLTVEMGLTEGLAMAAVKEAVTIYAATDASGSNARPVADSQVTWEWVDTYDAYKKGPYTVKISCNGEELGTVEVEVNIAYGEEDKEESNEITIGGDSYEEKTVYVLVDAPENGKKYLISNVSLNNYGSLSTDWNDEEGVILVKNGTSALTYDHVTINTGSNTATDGIFLNSGTITVDGVTYSDGYITMDTENSNAVWTTTASSSAWRISNGSHYLRLNNNTPGVSTTTYNWYYSGNRLRYNSNTGRYLYFSYNSNGSWAWNSTSSSSGSSARDIFFYKAVTAKVPTSSQVIYTMWAEDLVHNLSATSMSAKLDYSLQANGKDANPLPEGGEYSFSGYDERIIKSIAADGTITFAGEAGSTLVKVAYTWAQEGKQYTVYKYVTVTTKVPNNYPEYPDEGAVKVGKTGTGIDFQSTGIAQVEISASGVPMSKGADVIVMLDTSSSMNSNKVKDDNGNTTSKTRLQVLQEALDAMVADFKAGGPNGEELDIRLAIADFNGYYDEGSGTPYDQDENDYHGNSSYDQDSKAKVYTGNGTLTAGAFQNINDIASAPDLDYTSGTNYDYAFDAIYQLGTAIKAENEKNGESRDLYVIFMSDGAAFQWNYYHSRNNQGNWGKWITGQYTTEAQVKSAVNCDDHYYYYDFKDHDNDGQYNEHRMANAIKGDPKEQFEIIRKTEEGLPEGTLTPVPSYENLYTVPGLGATMFTINFDAQTDGSVQQADIRKSLASTASEQTGAIQYYYEINTVSDLGNAFDTIGSDMAYAAYNARYVDQMGEDYDLQLKPLKDLYGNALEEQNKIEVIEYDIYTRTDCDNGKCTEDQIGDRKGTYKILETVTFNPDGTEAYSSLIDGGQTNILIDGVICAKNFYYNTSKTDSVEIEGISIPTGVDEHNLTTGSTNMLPAETFYWDMGTVKTTELALRYYVYLTGSMEGTREAGSYPTNEYANLYYDNFVGNPCHKDTVSPVLPWKEANVSYAFYLVDEQGRIVVNQTTGEIGSFANKIAVTNPVVHSTIKLNDEADIDAAQVAASGVLPEGYTLYDAIYGIDGGIVEGATYTVRINSDSTGSWAITGPKSDNTTYVMQHNPSDTSAYDNTENVDSNTYDYSHTVVWFAVVWKIQALPDTVVVDYGLPVDISVLANDMFGDHGKLAGVGPEANAKLDGHTAGMADGFATEYTGGTYGTAKANPTTGRVRYTLNTMEMNGYERFAYAVSYTGSVNAGYYYDTVTVIPATTIYYEDSFLEYSSFEWDYDTNDWAVKDKSLWTLGAVDENAVQGEDRPGRYSLTDANNIYGYDGVNLGMSTYSLGSAAMATVDYDNYAQARFTFWGTGFDIISMTSNMTGTILIDVENWDGEKWVEFDSYAVDTYYGYKQIPGDANGDEVIDEGEMIWVVDPDANGSIYQVPVIKMANKPYDHYRVTIRAVYERIFDHVEGSNSYDFYLDAIRIYDPANDGASDGSADTTIEDAYIADGEGWPSYIELRNGLIAANSFDGIANEAMTEKMTGLVFIDGDGSVGNNQMADYLSYGPNNEVYLAPGQSVSFLLNTPANVANVHIGMSLAFGTKASYTISNIALMDSVDGQVKTGDIYNQRTFTLETATDMYYNLTGWKNDIILITNTGSGTISITNIKSTYTSDPTENTDVVIPEQPETIAETEQLAADSRFTYVYMTAAAANVVLDAMNTVKEPEQIVPETFAPALFHVMVNRNELKVGQKILVTVTTSSDVEYVCINGEKVTTYNQGGTGNRTWRLMVTAMEAGTMNVEVVCFNADDVASEAVVQKVNVKRNGLLGLMDRILN